MESIKQRHFLASGSSEKVNFLFQRVREEYPFYRRILDEQRLNPTDDPLSLLDRFPAFDRTGYLQLQEDIFSRLKGKRFLTEYTSGTTGPRKIRFVTERDEAAEEELCVRFFRQCGLNSTDRVLALDVDSPDIYLFYSRALSRTGVHNFSYLNFIGSGEDALRPFFTFRPTVILSIPSVLARCKSELARISHREKQGYLKKVVYIAENMSPELRHMLSEEMGLQVFSFYGSTEIGSMAGECEKHEGIHLFNDTVVPTLIDPHDDGDCLTGEVAWTTLHFVDQPLIKYINGDIISVQKKPCSCGSDYPLMTRVTRTDDIFAIYGQKFRYEDFAGAIAKQLGSIDSLKIIITSDDRCDKVVFQVPDYMMKERKAVLRAIQSVDDFAYFLEMGFVRSDVQSCLDHGILKRKSVRIVDRRSGVVREQKLMHYSTTPPRIAKVNME